MTTLTVWFKLLATLSAHDYDTAKGRYRTRVGCGSILFGGVGKVPNLIGNS